MANLASWFRAFGISPGKFIRSSRGLGRYLSGRNQLQRENPAGFEWSDTFPILDEWDESSGSLGAYFFQDRLVARWIHEVSPEHHYDVGSRLDGFIGSLSVFRKVDVIDIRPQPVPVPNVTFHLMDLMQELPADWIGKADSLSCLHTIEHFGLGRYGDPLDAEGHLKGLMQLKRLVAPGGLLYLSTPIGPQRIEFNAHRVFALATVLEWFSDGWEIERLAVIDDSTRVLENISTADPKIAGSFGCRLGVGIIVAKKNAK